MSHYQLIIIGGGPAGLTAGIYAARARLNTLLLEKAVPGGQIINSEWVENYPGFPEGISGFDLGELMQKQAASHGVEIKAAEVTGLELEKSDKVVITPGERYVAKAVIIAAARIYVIHRRDQLRADKILQERALASEKIEVIWDTVVEAINGESRVENLQLKNVKTGEKSTLEIGGVFMAVGTRPNTAYLADIMKLGKGGTISVNSRMETEIPGIFAAGDIREGSIRQVIAAAGDGAIAAMAAEEYIASK